MSTDVNSFYREWPSRISHARASAPDAAKGFGAMFQSVMRPGALSVSEKELLALAIGMSVRCEPCIYIHVEKALKAGATREQVLEAAGVAVMMQGGPTYTYLPKVVEALDELKPEEAAAVGVAT
ncbi:MAG TPA: carboxymuconolactone decarboxylase family protein [Tepidisphaeraceae bacterium]|nr:carboxymuconolactone decarboxylase family protein [Tepidisphaeraceae bacterium]